MAVLHTSCHSDTSPALPTPPGDTPATTWTLQVSSWPAAATQLRLLTTFAGKPGKTAYI